jgi:dUTP pyrophosphatase
MVVVIDSAYRPTLKIFVNPKLDPEKYFPAYATEGSAGFDVKAHVPSVAFPLRPGERRVFETGLSVIVPEGYELQVRPRSGLSIKYGITVINAPGTIDSDYRGRLMVALVNLGGSMYTIKDGDRIAQCVLSPVTVPHLTRVESINPFETERGEGGFGSTGR